MRSKKTPQNQLSIALERHQEEHHRAAGHRQPFHVSPGPISSRPVDITGGLVRIYRIGTSEKAA
jgi:hypothetical protein